MTDPRYPTANDREAAKRAGAEPAHPADKNPDPLAAQIADQTDKPPAKKARLKNIGGSENDSFNIALAEATRATAWIANEADRAAAVSTVSRGLAAVAPRDELEGMLGAQLVAAHQASMECFRRAMIPDQTIPGREMNLNQANKASRTFATLLEALNRHRSKGQQRVIVEHVHRHVHVHDSGSTIPATRGGGHGGQVEKASQPHAQQTIGYAIEPALRSEDPGGEPLSLPCDGERQVSDARRCQSGRADG